jgi:hypothetical protein
MNNRIVSKLHLLLILTFVLALAACSDDSTSGTQTGDVALEEDAASASDASDMAARDTDEKDAGEEDTGEQDAGDEDTGAQDAGAEDTGVQDAGTQDVGPQDAGQQDAGQQDVGQQDTGQQDAGIDSGLSCTPGDTKQVECNTCTCTQQRVWSCTKMACPGGPYEPCKNKSCGETCTLCDPADPNCNETAVVKYCDENGHCSAQNSPQCSI